MVKGSKSFIVAVLALLVNIVAQGQERVYVSTDKNAYLAGEDLWCSVYCQDGNTGKYSNLSSVAYLEFHSAQGVEDLIKIPLVEGRGCGRLQIPFDFATGNYSIVAYTKLHGGDSKGDFSGKVVTVYNTVTAEKVDRAVEIVEQLPDAVAVPAGYGDVMIGAKADLQKGVLPVKITNTGMVEASINVSVFHYDELEKNSEGLRSASGTLLERKGDFAETGVTDFAGEVITLEVEPLQWSKDWWKGVYVYMSAKGNEDDLYVGRIDSLGRVTYYTNNMSGDKDLMIEVVDNVAVSARFSGQEGVMQKYKVKVLENKYNHKAGEIPVLKISRKMRGTLDKRSMRMQIGKRFAADSIFNLMPMRTSSYLGAALPLKYNLDDYTRFPTVDDVVREYVSYLRIRTMDGVRGFKVVNQDGNDFSWASKGQALALLDGVPVRDHNMIINMDPLLIKEIQVYPRQIVLNHFVFDGVVKFNTYKGDMGGLKMGENFSIVPHSGVQYPLAFLGDGILENLCYPNYNSTLYWNPLVEVREGETFEFSCPLPKYRGEFKIVVEGIDGAGNGIYKEAVVSIE